MIGKTLPARTVARRICSCPPIPATDPTTQAVAGRRTIADMAETGDSVWISADTLDELAAKMGVPADALIQTIDDFNSPVGTGEADGFGPYAVQLQIRNRPLVRLSPRSAAHHTMGGVEIDTRPACCPPAAGSFPASMPRAKSPAASTAATA